MKLGVEEEFFLINPSTMFLYPAAPRIGLSLVLKEKAFRDKFTMEFPHSSSAFRYPFSIAELKTAPQKDIDSLSYEVKYNRQMLKAACEKNGLKILASGAHPFSHPSIHGAANCCALHIHVSGINLKRTRSALQYFIGPLISLAANSPFLCGRRFYYCSRLAYSPFVGTRDISEKRDFATVETRIFDTQITSKRVMSLAALVVALAFAASKNINFGKIEKDVLAEERNQAIRYGFPSSLAKKRLEAVLNQTEDTGLKEDIDLLFEEPSGSSWQSEVAQKNGFGSLLLSLFESFEKDELCIVKGEDIDVRWNTLGISKLMNEIPYILAFLPLIARTKIKTYYYKLPSEIARWVKELST